jgi:uncharacterized repeat protein (TIGR03803 family)
MRGRLGPHWRTHPGHQRDFYGVTEGGKGPGGPGTVFKITPSGTLTTLHTFCSESGCADGWQPLAGLVQATNGDLYGTTSEGDSYAHYSGGNGTVFKINPSGTLTTLHRFCATNCADGSQPYAGLVQATDGNLYGTTSGYGSGIATVFKIALGGKLTTLYTFCSQGVQPDYPDGDYPFAGLVQATNGDLYGTTSQGGANCTPYGCGTVFSLSIGLGPFVEALPASGKVGAGISILGTNLTGATSVDFNGTPAVFTVLSSSEIIATVPAGATTGSVQVVTPSGRLSSSAVFRVP